MEKLINGICCKTVEKEADVYFDMALTMLEEIMAHNAKGEKTVMIVPVGPTDHYPLLAELVNRTMMKHCEGMNAEQKSVVAAKLKQITGGTANYRNITDEAVLRKIYETFKEDNEA